MLHTSARDLLVSSVWEEGVSVKKTDRVVRFMMMPPAYGSVTFCLYDVRHRAFVPG
jgi:hypothetical protein